MTDNPHDKMMGSILAKTITCEQFLKKALPEFLERSGCTPKYREEIQTFLKPVLGILDAMESEVIQYTRLQQITALVDASVSQSQIASLQNFADMFTELANSPQAMKAAASFRIYLKEMIKDKEPVKGKEPVKTKDHER